MAQTHIYKKGAQIILRPMLLYFEINCIGCSVLYAISSVSSFR